MIERVTFFNEENGFAVLKVKAKGHRDQVTVVGSLPSVNARAETLSSRPFFKPAYQNRRCLVPADSFFEWQERDGKRQPFRIMQQNGQPFCFAGLWERWDKPPAIDQSDNESDAPSPSQTVESFTIITAAANLAIKPLHDRMPVIVQEQHYAWWLDCGAQNSLFTQVLKHQGTEPLKIYPVSSSVNSVKTDDPSCIEPVHIERDMFEKQWWESGI